MYFAGEHDYINVNGSGTRAAVKLAEEDVCDKSNRKSEVYSNNSNNTRTLTQQSSLVAPSEVLVSISPALTAEPVLTPNGMLTIVIELHFMKKKMCLNIQKGSLFDDEKEKIHHKPTTSFEWLIFIFDLFLCLL